MTLGSWLHRLGVAFGDLAAEVHRHHLIGDAHHHRHVVLDEQHREAELLADLDDGVAQLVDLAVGETGGGLVHQEELGPGGERPGDLEPLQRAERQPGGGAMGERPEPELVRAARRRTRLICWFSLRAPMRVIARANPTWPWLWAPTITFSSSVIVGNSARFWNVRAMPSAAIPCAGTSSRSWPSKSHTSGGRLVDAADDVEHRRLAGAVRTDQPADLTVLDREAQAVQRNDAPEAHGDLANIK